MDDTLDARRERLEPYRSKQGKLLRSGDRRRLLLDDLHHLCDGSPAAACEYLGYAPGSASNIARYWTEMGLETTKRNHAVTSEFVTYKGFVGGEDADAKRKRYLAVTGRIEYAPVREWVVPKGTEYARLIGVSDLHYGPPEMDYRRWLDLRDWIAENPDVRWVGLGDMLNVSTKESVGSPDYLPYDDAYEMCLDDLRPIAKQCLLLLDGNHEARISKALKIKLSPAEMMAKELDIHYGGNNEFLRLRLKCGKHEQVYDGFCHHGFGGAQTPGGKINYLYRMYQSLTAGFLLMGHVHMLTVEELIRIGLRNETHTDKEGREWVEVEQTTYPMAFCGSFLKYLRGSYARDRGMMPASLGAGTLHLYAERHAAHGRV